MADIELIIKIPEEAKQAFDCAESNDLKGGYYDHGGVIGNAIKNGTPIPDNASNGEWVDVNERLPEEYGEYLITWKTNDSSTPFISVCEYETSYEYDVEKHRFKGEWLVDDYILVHSDYEIVAWMPLPAPYQKGGKE